MDKRKPLEKKYLIVSADDLGIDEAVNAEIRECVENGIVTSVSLLATGDAFSDGVRIVRALPPRVGVGVHLALDTQRSILGHSRLPSLTSSEGVFFSRWKLLSSLVTGRVYLQEVYHEWSAQIQTVLDQGIVPDHLDGHGHMHVFPALTGITAHLARRYNISAIRIPLERKSGSLTGTRMCVRALLTYAGHRAQRALRGEMNTPQRVLGLGFAGGYDEPAFMRDLRSIELGSVIEAIFHPGPRESRGLWTRYRAVDSSTLRSLRVRALIKEKEIALIRFADLSACSDIAGWGDTT